ncbi:MAG: TetR/AcrR family transcriptional regulator [Actinomycetota bacterium]
MPRIRAETIEEHKALTRGQIFAATRQILADTGSGDLSLGDVAATAGIGRTTFYEYFHDRDDLVASLVEAELPAVITRLIGRLARNRPPDELLLDLAEQVVEFVATDPELGVILHGQMPRMGPQAQDRIRLAHGDLSAAMVGLFQTAAAQGKFRPMAPDLAGRLIQDTIMSAARAVIASPDRLDEVKANLRAFLRGGFAA